MPTNEHLLQLNDTALKLGLKTEFFKLNGVNYNLFISDGTRYCVIDGYKSGYYPNNTKHFSDLANSKLVSERFLKEAGFNTLTSHEVKVSEYTSATKMFTAVRKKLPDTYPLLIKPEVGLKGKGIVVVSTDKQLESATKHLHTAKKNFLVQKIEMRTEYRVLYAHGDVVFVHSKAFPTIVGDGKKTAGELFEKIEKSKRDRQFFLLQLKERGLTRNSVLEKGYHVPYHVTRKGSFDTVLADDIPAGIKKWAKKLAQALKTDTVGIDVFIDGPFEKVSSYQIIEVNANPGFSYIRYKYKRPDVVEAHCQKILKSFFKL